MILRIANIVIVLILIPGLFISIQFIENQIDETPQFYYERVIVSSHRHIIHSLKNST